MSSVSVALTIAENSIRAVQLSPNLKILAFGFCITTTKTGEYGELGRRLVNCPESNSKHYNYTTKAKEEKLSIYVGNLHGTQPINLLSAVYETRKYGGVRGALRKFLAEPSTRL